MIGRLDIESRESATLAAYAAHAADSRGRVYPQEQHPLRTAFQRDRDRIIHAAAFRRMEYKTQVFIPHLVDHYRTRMTHTIEVAQIARTLARNLRLNEDLTEAISLVHDLGHTPFGHSGEDALNELLSNLGGFNHNRQSLRIVDLLERRYPKHPGLNLSYEVREGIVKHETRNAFTPEEFRPGEHPTLEAALVDKADELAYSAHDIDDGLNSGLLKMAELRTLAIWDDAGSPWEANSNSVSTPDPDNLRYRLVRFLINLLATDLMNNTAAELERQNISSLEELRLAPDPVCHYSSRLAPRFAELKRFLSENLYHHPTLQALAKQARETVTVLFEKICAEPTIMPHKYRSMLESARIETVVADYIAGMTDRFAKRLFDRLIQS